MWRGSRCGPAHSTGRVALTRVYLGILRGYGDSSEGACHVLVVGERRQHLAIRPTPDGRAAPEEEGSLARPVWEVADSTKSNRFM